MDIEAGGQDCGGGGGVVCEAEGQGRVGEPDAEEADWVCDDRFGGFDGYKWFFLREHPQDLQGTQNDVITFMLVEGNYFYVGRG